MWLAHEKRFRRVTSYADIAQVMVAIEAEQSEHDIREIGKTPSWLSS